MSGLSYAPIAVKSDAQTYYGFRGIDRSRDITAMETEKEQHFWNLNNCYVDYRGQLIRDPAFYLLQGSNRYPVKAVRFYSREGFVFAEEDAAHTHLASDRGHRVDGAYEIQRRMAVAGFKDRPTVIEFSRVDDPDIFLNEESFNEEVTRAAFIDIGNLIGTADEITGLGAFEANRLAVFTNDQTLVYLIDPDLEEWQLDSRANLRVGCISHNTIANAGSDLLFCSRKGIHSIMRSEQNGLTIAEASLSDEVENLYQELVRTTPDPKSISAVFDSDTLTYHVFFPRPGGQNTKRLSMNFRSGYQVVNFQLGDTLYPRCGAFLGGKLFFGTADGVYEATQRVFDQDTGASDLRRDQMIAETPVLWLGDFLNSKRSHTLILQATGKGRFFVDAVDENDVDMQTIEVNLDRLEKDPKWGDMPLREDYAFPFPHVFRGIRLRFRTEEVDSQSEITIISFSFLIHKEK